MKEFDFIAIGDVVTDAFIKLSEAHVTHEAKEDQICMQWGTKLPYDGVVVVPAVGNCANAAVAAVRLGLSSALLSNTGDDKFADEQIETLEKNKVATDYVVRHAGMPSNYHYVLSFKGERTILVKHEKYSYTMPDVGSPKWFYVTSLGEHSLEFHGEILKYLESHSEIKLAFQPGTFQIKLGKEKLAGMYKRTDVFFCNVEEAQKILGVTTRLPAEAGTGGQARAVLELSQELAKLGPKIVCITDGPDGAYVYDGSNKELWFQPAYPDQDAPVDRTGAGDAFASTFVSALALGKTVAEALAWGPVNSMNVIKYYGAQEGLLPRAELEAYLNKAGAVYKAEKRN